MEVNEIGGLSAEEPGENFLYPVEEESRLSQSLLWKVQRNYFHREGMDAWRTNTVPYYITNNPALARAYAEVVLGFLRDCLGGGANERDCAPLDPGQPVYIVELGAGCGRFGFLFLRALMELREHISLPLPDIRYVLTDFTESNLAFWRSHESLQPFFDRGVLDLALFDAESDCEIRLERSGETLSPNQLRNPLVLLANYVFDGVPHDAFTIKDGKLSECLVSLFSNQPELDCESPEAFQHLAVGYTSRPASADYYREPEFNSILAEYASSFEDATLLFPCAALRTIERLGSLSGGRLLLLTADKGEVDVASLGRGESPYIAVHGSFSMQVNYHAIGEYFVRSGGQALRTSHRHSHLTISGGLLGSHPGGFPETRLAFHRALEQNGPDDFHIFRHGVRESYQKLELPHLFSLIRLSGYDPKILHDCVPSIRAQIPRAPDATAKELAQIVCRVQRNYFHIGEAEDLPFEFALLLFEASCYEQALSLFGQSRRLYGDDPKTAWNEGLCYAALNRAGDALERFRYALSHQDGFVPWQSLQSK